LPWNNGAGRTRSIKRDVLWRPNRSAHVSKT
jgi:hypothetical protein